VLVRERQILDRLQDLSLPTSVPRFEHFSSSRDTFPWHFAAYPYLPGTPLSHIDDKTIVTAIAPQIGEFLAALHQAPMAAELPSPWDDVHDNSWARHEFDQSTDAYPSDLCKRVDAYLQVSPHADLLEDHILVDPKTGMLAGIIDWADACTRIRSSDFAGLYYAGGQACAARAYATYNVEPAASEWRWLQHSAVVIGIGNVYYGHHTNQPQRVANGLDRVHHYLP
jgi:aminoglycoside phosphotransferase (APT) family kinase protein